MTEYEANDVGVWSVPYLPIDPTDVGRTYESIIRINSQSGKGGVAYILDHEFGIKMPKNMHPEFGTIIQEVTDREGRELKSEEIYQTFEQTYLEIQKPYDLHSFHVMKRHSDKQEKLSFAEVEAAISVEGEERVVGASGNGPLDAFATALKANITGDFTLVSYHEHAINTGSSARAIAYIEVECTDGARLWGAGIDTDIMIASVKALLSSLNRCVQD
jgi:2-isopropylmalate synthase